MDIDNHGQIVGEYSDASGIFHGFLRDASGNFTTIDVPGATGTSIRQPTIAARWWAPMSTPKEQIHGFLLEQGVVTTIDAPGATVLTLPFAINNHGQIVGVSFDGVRYRGFLLSNGTFTRITPPGAFFLWFLRHGHRRSGPDRRRFFLARERGDGLHSDSKKGGEYDFSKQQKVLSFGKGGDRRRCNFHRTRRDQFDARVGAAQPQGGCGFSWR